MRLHGSSRRVWGDQGARWAIDGGIPAEVARDERGQAPGQWGDEWRSAPLARPKVTVDEDVPVTCWCELEIVSVPLELVRAGLTYACDTEECRRREEAACQRSAG